MTPQDFDMLSEMLYEGERAWWDVVERRMVRTATIDVPFGCGWNKCTICPFRVAVQGFRSEFNNGNPVSDNDLLELFRGTIRRIAKVDDFHTVVIFNGGSFLEMSSEVREAMVGEITGLSAVRRVVIESRAEFVTPERVGPLAEILSRTGRSLTIRIGVETKNNVLRERIRKGQSEGQIRSAAEVLSRLGVNSGGYVLLCPVPGLDPCRAIEETTDTIRWILDGDTGLGMDEAYFCSTNVGEGTPLKDSWMRGIFRPANLWMVLRVLINCEGLGGRLHLLPFKDQPPLLAVPSNHVSMGIPQSLMGATGCDLEFHQMLDRYRATMDPVTLVPPTCACRPDWF